MFDPLLAPPTIGVRRIRAVITALLAHVLLIVAARNTASPHGAARPVARDTIPLELIEVSRSGARDAESPPSLPKAAIPEAPAVPGIPISAPELRLPPFSDTAAGHPESSLASLHRNSGKPAVTANSFPSVSGTIEVDDPPELIHELHPRYPGGLRAAAASGLVRVQYVVGIDGRMDQRSVRVLSSSHPEFLLAALEALRTARFKPARRGGRPVAVLVAQTFRFRLR